LTDTTTTIPTDGIIIGIVDSMTVDTAEIYRKDM
jgi:hypothetical protein